ncbi:class I SAM-dependent methyltransferase [Sporomusa aerivorans]|uniref:class I SAM-dependent methyltransferase n=1 Tax=Sporomusa aerivorans TaxID=204936 RepID=UPI00352B5508
MKCPYCKNENTVVYYSANMPNILSACNAEILNNVKVLPLEARLCPNCLLGFNSKKISDEDLKFIYDNYLYISPLQGIGTSKYEGMVNTLLKYFNQTDRLVEVGCSEGYLLRELKNRGYEHLVGIEPGPQAAVADNLGIKIMHCYFNENTLADELIDGFYLMHVFEHLPDPFSLLSAMKKSLCDSGKIVIEVPNFEGYHHQHLFFYNIYFFGTLCKNLKLKIVDFSIEKDALRVVLVHDTNTIFSPVELPLSDIGSLLSDITAKYTRFQANVDRINELLQDESLDKLYVWGAGSAGVITLNQALDRQLAKAKIVVVDGDSQKWGNYIPGLNIKVQSLEILKGQRLKQLIVCSSFYNEIAKTMENNNIYAENIEVLI